MSIIVLLLLKAAVKYLEIDCKGRDLLRKAQEINGRVEQVGLELRFEINWTATKDG